jgi:hypothetical protein
MRDHGALYGGSFAKAGARVGTEPPVRVVGGDPFQNVGRPRPISGGGGGGGW